MNKSIFRALGVLAQNKGMNKYLNIFKETGEGIKSKGMDFFNKAIIFILLFGFFIYTFCPFNTCYTNPDDPLYIRDFNRAAKELVCSYTDNNVSYSS